MSTYRCLDCGEVFEDYELCPCCGGDCEELFECPECGEKFEQEFIENGVCENCLKNLAKDLEMCCEVGKLSPRQIKINDFLGFFFSEKEIEEILYNHLKNIENARDDMESICHEYIMADPSWYVEHREKVLENLRIKQLEGKEILIAKYGS